MKVLKVDARRNYEKQIDLIVGYFKNGKIIIYPTDTIYGIGCDATNGRAVNKVKKIKQSDSQKPLLMLVNGFPMLKKYCLVSPKQIAYLRTLWPGKFSVILKKRKTLPAELTGGGDSVGVRFPKNDFLIKLIAKFHKPVVSTSANISFKKPLCDVSRVEKHFKILPDLVVDAGKCQKSKASKLIDARDVDNIKILRK